MANPIEAIGLGRPPELLSAPGKPPALLTGPPRFAAVLSEALKVSKPVSFSAHARQRLEERSIDITPRDETRIERAVDEAALKGARESLLILGRTALVVSVPNRTVITVMEPNPADNMVVTNIDSVVVVRE